MCGRYTIRLIQPILESFAPVEAQLDLFPRFNIAPTQDVPAVRWNADDNRRELVALHWGLIPSWAKDRSIGSRMINARAETIEEKPAFRTAYRQRRCLIPADGFYEWKRDGKIKIPHFIRMADEAPFAFAGLWERWNSPEGRIDSCTILTTTPNEMMADIHDRMPVILDRGDYDTWLNPRQSADALRSLLRPYPAERMFAYPVSARVNSPANDGADLVQPATAAPPAPPARRRKAQPAPPSLFDDLE